MQRNSALALPKYPYALNLVFQQTIEYNAQWKNFVLDREKALNEERKALENLRQEYDQKTGEGIQIDVQMWKRLDRDYEQNSINLRNLQLTGRPRLSYTITLCVDKLTGFWKEIALDFECEILSEEQLIKYLTMFHICEKTGNDHPSYNSEAFEAIKKEILKYLDKPIFQKALSETMGQYLVIRKVA